MSGLRLLGYPVSNYVNIVRAALLEKELDFEFVATGASQDEAFLRLSPLGKIPVLETDVGALTETVAILDYLDDAFPESPLRPEEVFARARSRQLINIVQLYVETPARQLFPGVFMGGNNSAETESSVCALLTRSSCALAQLMRPDPYLFGDRPGQADLFAYYNLDIANRVTTFVYGWSLTDRIEGLGRWLTAMRNRDSTAIVMRDFETSFAAYLGDHGAAYCTTALERPIHA